ncbi:girdin-like isoform X2 [Syngnathoides biaculeatus]|uniref:girdin-like isoform X2 n=1 Tax=Syngnathoides biaculeatus TaxID=300417 RepID=UPI002ADDF8AC|nr:girdin-like isoform X2 [Syngnathoides biaculeatus]
MESGAFVAFLERFMMSPLVTWVKTFASRDEDQHVDFSELLDGVFLNSVMSQIHPPATPQAANKLRKDPSQRVHNLTFLVQQIKTYYLENLRQLILIPLPNVLLLSRTPPTEQSLLEMKKLLLLLLGCAVQCEKKEGYIEIIQTLDFDTKAAIAIHIQELTHGQDNLLDLHWLESTDMPAVELEVVAKTVAVNLQHLLDQRNAHLETIAELTQEREGVVRVLCSSSSPQSAIYPPSMQQQQAGTQQHLVVDLADSKAKIRRLRQELEEKSEQILESRHELENVEAELKRIQQENLKLLVDARAARAYRDELDALKERAIKADKLESEVARYREQLHKMDFYKAKVEELKEDNRVLQETKEVLEDQLAGWRERSDKIHQLEKHNLLLKVRIHEMEQGRDADRKCIEELQDENLTLCLAQRRTMEESQHLGWELEQLSKTTEYAQGQQTVRDEVSERIRSRLLKLEKENQSLLKTVEELRDVCTHNNAQTNKHCLNPEKDRVHQVVCCTDKWTSSTKEYIMSATPCSHEQNCRNVDSIDAVKQKLSNTDSQYKESVQVHTDVHLSANAAHHIQEKGQLEGTDSGEHFKAVMSDLEVSENSHNAVYHSVGSNNPSRGSGSSSSSHDCTFMGLPALFANANKHTERLEAKCKALDSINQQLQTSFERKIQRLEAEVQELEADNHSLQASLEELRITVRRLEQVELEKQSLERETAALEKVKRQLEKENRRLHQQTEIQEANLDSSNVCMASLEREMRCLVKEVEELRETAERVKKLERDNREQTKQADIDQRTLDTLREELVSEKLRTRQREDELQRLSHEQELRIRNRERKQSVEADTAEHRFNKLESELELSMKRSIQIKDEKMAVLEARLQESSTLNQELRQELRTVKLSYEALQQKQEEEMTASSTSPLRDNGKAMSEWLRESHEATKELLNIKDRLIEVERSNATLETERQATQAHLKQLESQSDSQLAQILVLQRQAASLQENNTTLQTHNADLQVEKSTLNSQIASLMAQNAQLQQQQAGTESERDGAAREREELRGAHEQLLRDHERLAALHERQATDYEVLLGKHGCLKNAHRTLQLEHRTLQDRYNSLLQQRTKLEDLEKALKEEQMRMSLEKENHRSAAAECCRLRDEKDWLNQTYHQLLNDNEVLTAEHKQLKSQLNESKLAHTWLEADFSKLKKDYQQLDITSTKLTNQCELLSQLKGNLEEENHHLLSQIDTLMLQNRTLLEQTMESKDLFHIEERQYIDKLNDLRRQKEKLEEKIMDQYKFYEPSPPRRRGNWITLKLKKLIKSNSHDQGLEHPPTPTHSEAHLSCHDSSSFMSSDGSGGSTSTAAGDAVAPQPHNNTPKLFPRMRNRLKNKEKVKSVIQRSLSLSSLMYTSASLGQEQWPFSSEELEGSEADVKNRKKRLPSFLSTSILSTLHLHPTTEPSTQLHSTNNYTDVPDVSELTDKDSNDSAVPSGFEDNDELQHHGLNITQSRAESESSGEFSMSLDNEPWSSGSSPVQQPLSRQSSVSYRLPSDTSTTQHTQQSSSTAHEGKPFNIPLTNSQESDLLPQQKESAPNPDFWLTRGTKSIRRGSKGKGTRRPSESGGVLSTSLRSNSNNTECTQASSCSSITVFYVQGKSSSMSGCLNCFSNPLGKEGRLKGYTSSKSLPRASSVISTADGSSRRLSVNNGCRVGIKTDTLPAAISEKCNNQEKHETVAKSNPKPRQDSESSGPELSPPVKPPRGPGVIVTKDSLNPIVQELDLNTHLSLNSVFSDTIFSDSGGNCLEVLERNDQPDIFLYESTCNKKKYTPVSPISTHNNSLTCNAKDEPNHNVNNGN